MGGGADTPRASRASRTPHAVVFDLGGVLIDWDPRQVFRQHFASLGAMEEFMAQHFWRVHHACHDTHAPFAETLAPYKDAHPHYADAFDVLATRWQEFLVGPIPGTVALLERLAVAGVPLYALTNWPGQTWPPAHPSPADYAFLDRFAGIVVSGEVQLRKPDRAIYRLARERFGLGEGEAVFIDDLTVNVEAADAEGFHGIQFVSPEQVTAALAELGFPAA